MSEKQPEIKVEKEGKELSESQIDSELKASGIPYNFGLIKNVINSNVGNETNPEKKIAAMKSAMENALNAMGKKLDFDLKLDKDNNIIIVLGANAKRALDEIGKNADKKIKEQGESKPEAKEVPMKFELVVKGCEGDTKKADEMLGKIGMKWDNFNRGMNKKLENISDIDQAVNKLNTDLSDALKDLPKDKIKFEKGEGNKIVLSLGEMTDEEAKKIEEALMNYKEKSESAEQQKPITAESFGRFYRSGATENWDLSKFSEVTYQGYTVDSKKYSGNNIGITAKQAMGENAGNSSFANKSFMKLGDGTFAYVVVGESKDGKSIALNENYQNLEQLESDIHSKSEGMEAWVGSIASKDGKIDDKSVTIKEVGDKDIHKMINVEVVNMGNDKENPLHSVSDDKGEYEFIQQPSLKFSKDELKKLYDIKEGKLLPKGREKVDLTKKNIDIAKLDQMLTKGQSLYIMAESLDFDNAGKNEKYDCVFSISRTDEGLMIDSTDKFEKREESNLGIEDGVSFDKKGFCYRNGIYKDIGDIDKDGNQSVYWQGMNGWGRLETKLKFSGTGKIRKLESVDVKTNAGNTINVSDLDLTLDTNSNENISKFYNKVLKTVNSALDQGYMVRRGVIKSETAKGAFEYDGSTGNAKIKAKGLNDLYGQDKENYRTNFFGEMKKDMASSRYYGDNMLGAFANRDVANRGALAKEYGNKMESYKTFIKEAQQAYGIPEGLLELLFERESGGNPNAKLDSTRVYGLGQIQDGTRNDLTTKIVNNYRNGLNGKGNEIATLLQKYPRNAMISASQKMDPQAIRAQIMASGLYLKFFYDTKTFGNWSKALVFYHMGPNCMTQPDSRYRDVASKNPAVAKFMTHKIPLKEDYLQAAAKYYSTGNKA